jgi:8-oxo-dGTP diphosphatase
MKTAIVCKAVIQNTDGKLLALRRSETDERRPLQWDIPGGLVEEGENFAEATARETEEEAGIKVDPEALQLVYTQQVIKQPKDEPLNMIWLFFVGHTDNTEVRLSEEHNEYRWITLDEALRDFEYPLHQELFRHLKGNDLLH